MTDVFDDLAKAFKAGHDAGRSEAVDEIERLREALRDVSKIKCEICCQYGRLHDKARAALGEKE